MCYFPANPRFVFSYKEHGLPGIVDGMTIDTEGNLWIANFDGNHVSTASVPGLSVVVSWCSRLQ